MSNDIREHVPLFHEPMQAAFNIQQERQRLQSLKRDAARAAERSQASLRRYHELVRRDDALTSQQRTLHVRTAGNAQAIRSQVALRRSQLEARLLELQPAQSVESGRQTQDSDSESSEIRFLKRAGRVYGFLDSRLEKLQENPKNPEWIRPLLKGMFFTGDEHEDPGEGSVERRLQQLQKEHLELQHRMARVRHEIEELGGDVAEDQTPGARSRPKPDRRNRGGDDSPRRPAPPSQVGPHAEGGAGTNPLPDA